MSNTSSNDVADPIDRAWPPVLAENELRLHWEFLDFLRITAVNKAAGLSRELAAATPIPTSPVLSVLGVIRHLTAVERWWLVIVGGDVDVPELWDEDPTSEWRLSAQDTPVTVVDAYRAEWQRAADALAGLGPNDRARLEVRNKPRTVRWLLEHVIQETARHVGHLDILRELADGEVGE